jgi:membrane protein
VEDGTVSLPQNRLVRTLTFWLRPAFALRALNRFQRIVGFDRSTALASSAFTALIPLALLVASVLGRLGVKDLPGQIIDRYGLSGGGAEAVRALFSFTSGPGGGFGVFGTLFLLISALSFARAAQRLFEQTWELPPLSVRNTLNGLRWLLALVGYTVVAGWLHALLDRGRFGLPATLGQLPLTAAFLVWSGWVLSAKRIPWSDLVPFGVLAAGCTAVYSFAAAVYLPRLFDTYATRYGAVGAVFALITALFGGMLTLVGCCAIGREVHVELVRIAEGQAPPADEIQREWANIVEQARERWHTAREELARRRQARNGDPDGDRQ